MTKKVFLVFPALYFDPLYYARVYILLCLLSGDFMQVPIFWHSTFRDISTTFLSF